MMFRYPINSENKYKSNWDYSYCRDNHTYNFVEKRNKITTSVGKYRENIQIQKSTINTCNKDFS